MYDDNERWRDYLGPLFNPQSYKNLAYMFISFPLGLIYFIGMIVGFALGAGLAIVLIGIPIILVTFALTWMAIGLERTIANILLGTNIPLLPSGNIRLGGGWRVNLLRFSNWKGIGYLFAKFPFGILSFALAVLTLSLPLSLLISPLAILFGTSNVSIMGWQVTSSPAAIVAFAIGLMITPVLLFINNRLMDIWRVFTVAMLTPARRETAQLDKAKRDFAYDNRRRVVVPDHTTVEDRYQDPDDYEKAKRHISDLLEDDAQDSNTYEKPKRKTLAELLAETDDDFS